VNALTGFVGEIDTYDNDKVVNGAALTQRINNMDSLAANYDCCDYLSIANK